MKVVKFFSLLALMVGMSACNQKQPSFEKTYKMGVAAGDYRAASNALLLWINQDSSIQNWAYDSLTYIHYFHLGGSSEQVRNPKTPLYYAEAGLKQNPKNTFLREIKAKLLLEQGKEVRMDHIAASVSESVNAKAAFIYLQALMLRAAGDILTSAKALEAALKEDQNFYAAKQSILDLQRMYAQQQRGAK